MGLLDELNAAQREAASTTEGPLLVLACAGSGKTRVVAHRLAHLIEQGLATSEQILVVTLTSRAADEIRTHVERLCGTPRRFPWLAPLPSTCVRLLREHCEALGLDRSFSIFDADDSLTLVREAMKALEMDEDSLPPERARAAIAAAKGRLEDVEAFEKAATTEEQQSTARLYRAYQQRLQDIQALDMDDLLARTMELLDRQPDLLALYQDTFRYVMVDNHEATSPAQQRLIERLAARHGNLCVLGDDDQGAFSWRGGDVSVLRRFQQDHPAARVIRLEETYRSTRSIVGATQALASHDPQRLPKPITVPTSQGRLPAVVELPDENCEARYVATRLKEMAREGREYGEFAVLYRTPQQARLLQEALAQRNIPLEVIASPKLWDCRVVKDLISYLRLAMNQRDDVSFKRIINAPPRSITTIHLGRMSEAARRRECSMFDILSQTDEVGNMTAKAMAAFTEVRAIIEDLRQRAAEREPVRDLLDRLIRRTDYKGYVAPARDPEAQANLQSVNALLARAAEFTRECEARGEEATLENFLTRGTLSSEVDTLVAAGDTVTLAPIQATAGLEFPVVFLVGMEEGLLPLITDNGTNVDEERRLCYLGMTRAREVLCLARAAQREQPDAPAAPRERTASRFLDEIPSTLLERETPSPSSYEDIRPVVTRAAPSRSSSTWRDSDSSSTRTSTPTRTSSRSGKGSRSTTTSRSGRSTATSREAYFANRPPPEPRAPRVVESAFSVGQKVVHKVFGEGQVVKVEGRTVTVDFPETGEKTVVESFLTASQPSES